MVLGMFVVEVTNGILVCVDETVVGEVLGMLVVEVVIVVLGCGD